MSMLADMFVGDKNDYKIFKVIKKCKNKVKTISVKILCVDDILSDLKAIRL